MTTLPMPPGQTPRQWQIDAMDATREGLRRYKSCIVAAATGTGKGSLIAGCAVRAASLGRRVLLLAHRDELVNDLVDRIRRVDGAPSVGLVKAERDEWGHPIVVASVQSCTAARRNRIGHVDVLLVDECHHALAPGYVAIFTAAEAVNPDVRRVGFTATPFRSGADGTTTGLGGVFEAVVYEYGIAAAIANGDLVPLRAYQVATQLDLSGVAIVGGDFDIEALSKAVDTPERNKIVVKEYIERAAGQPALVFGCSVLHAQNLAQAFRDAGIAAAAAWGEMPLDERRSLVAQFKRADGSLPVLCSKDLIFEGFDAPATRLILKARPTKSRVVFTQMIGRGLRLYPGKTECIFVDVVDNGCALDLSTMADLTDPGAAEAKAARMLAVGDRVRRWHHDDWSVGVVVEVHPGVLTLVKVDWPPSSVHPQGIELTHPAPELRWIPPDAQASTEQLSLGGHALTSKAYEVFLLPGVRKADRIGFYEYSRTLSAAGDLPGGDRFVVLVKADLKGRGWEVWERRGEVAARRHTTVDREVAVSWADSHLRAAGVRLDALDAAWRESPCTSAQRRLLGANGVQRDKSDLSQGEAAMILDAVITLRAVRQVEDPAKFRTAEAIRNRYRGGKFARRSA